MAKTRDELEEMTKDELVAYADDNDIDVQQSWLKDDIIKEIIKAEKATAKSEPTKSGPAKSDSIAHHEERKAKIQDENKANQQINQDLADNQAIANFRGLPQEGETREQLLARIRKLRDEKPSEAIHEPFRSEGLQKEFEAEQKAGQEAVAKAKEEREHGQQAQRELERGEKNPAG